MSDYETGAVNPFGAQSLQEAQTDMYGLQTADLPDVQRVIAKPVGIDEIWPDLTQPRRVVPAEARKGWDGSPEGILSMLARWLKMVAGRLYEGERFNVDAILTGDDFIDVNIENHGAVVSNLVALVELAVNIRDKGLNNPITVSRQNGRYLLHTGERRLLAHHLLHFAHQDGNGSSKYETVAAIEKQYDKFSQIAENTQRRDMNAISLARSLAILIMETRKDDYPLESYEAMVEPGGCDRAYYAQAVPLSIQRGQTDNVLNALNVSNRSWVSRYRALLSLPDKVWDIADAEDWSERRLRLLLDLPEEQQIMAAELGYDMGSIQDLIDANHAAEMGDMLPMGNITPQKRGELSPMGDNSIETPRNSYHEPTKKTELKQPSATTPSVGEGVDYRHLDEVEEAESGYVPPAKAAAEPRTRLTDLPADAPLLKKFGAVEGVLNHLIGITNDSAFIAMARKLKSYTPDLLRLEMDEPGALEALNEAFIVWSDQAYRLYFDRWEMLIEYMHEVVQYAHDARDEGNGDQ